MTPQTLGDLAVAAKKPPKRCSRCRVSFAGKRWHSYLAHMGLHGYADRFFGGDISKAAERLARNGLSKQDPAPWNGAFPYKPAQIFNPKGAMMKTDFSQIQFDADPHRYYLNGKELTSVTKYLKAFQKPFDRIGNAQRVAEREGKTTAEVLIEWDAKAENGKRLGLTVHAHIQQVLLGAYAQQSFDHFTNLNLLLPEITHFNAFWQKLAPKVNYLKDHIEWVIGDQELGLAGTLDALLYSEETKLYHIWDWKTGKFDLNNQFSSLLPPFDYLDASKFHIYSLQTSLYRLIVERNTGLPLGHSYIVHLTPTGYEIHRAVDLRERLLDYMEVPF